MSPCQGASGRRDKGGGIGGRITAQHEAGPSRRDGLTEGWLDMADNDREELQGLLAHSGFTLEGDELEDILRVFRVNKERLLRLHEADLDDEEVAGAFTPMWKEA